MSRERATTRRRAREVAFRVTYQADLTHDTYAQAWNARRDQEALSGDSLELVEDVIRLLERDSEAVDRELTRAAENWPLERLGATDRSVLRAAIAELMSRPGTPARVVLDEAIDIAKRYGTDDSGRFVNGVLDRVARSLRPAEF